MKALFIGRFEPLHKGHVHVLRKLMKKYEKVIIGIGSLETSEKNPFTLEERKRMIRLSLGKGNYRIMAIPDFGNDRRWVEYIKKHIKFDVAVSGNPHVIRCFKALNINTLMIKHYKSAIYDASKIRERVRKEGNWRTLVPRKTWSIIRDKYA